MLIAASLSASNVFSFFSRRKCNYAHISKYKFREIKHSQNIKLYSTVIPKILDGKRYIPDASAING